MSQSDTSKDPTQVAPRNIDTSMPWLKDLSKKQIVPLIPPLLTAIVFAIAFVAGWGIVSLISLVLTVALIMPCVYLAITPRWYTSPVERVVSRLNFRSQQQDYPKGFSDSVAEEIHHVNRILDDGTAEMSDGRLVGIYRVYGTNSDRMSKSERNELVSSFSAEIAEEIKDFSFRFHSTTFDFDTDTVVSKWDSAIHEEHLNEESAVYQRELLKQASEWFRNRNEPKWEARDWRHYIVVEAYPRDIDRPQTGSEDIFDRLYDRLNQSGLSTVGSRRTRAKRVDSRLSSVEQAILSVEGLTGERISPDEHAQLLLKYWAGEDHKPEEHLSERFGRTPQGPSVWTPERFYPMDSAPDPDTLEDEVGNKTARDRLYSAFPTRSSEDEQPTVDEDMDDEERNSTAHMLAPGVFEVSDEYVRVGDEYVKTYWIESFPPDVPSQFLRRVYSMRGVDVDVTIHVQDEEKQTAISDLRSKRAKISATTEEKYDSKDDLEALDIENDKQAYELMYGLLRETNTQPWRISAYVNVRAGERQAIEQLEDGITDHSTIDSAALDKLNERAIEVKDTFNASPASCTLKPAGINQRDAFVSASPTGPHLHEQNARVTKMRRVLSGTVGATFPFGTATIQEEDGLLWGRNMQNGSALVADPFKRGTAPHGITFGTSRSGKTYSISDAMSKWYAEEDDRTLIFADTQSGFAELTKVLDGEHIVIGGNTGVNPLHIEAVSKEKREGMDESVARESKRVDQFKMKAEEVVEFFAGILRSQEVNPADYNALLKQAIYKTYFRAGIRPDNPETFSKPSPTASDLIETIQEMSNSPEKYTHSDSGHETETKAKTAGELLNYLSGFTEDGEYRNMLDESSKGLLGEDTDMGYLDLQQLTDRHAAVKSSMFLLMLGQVTQKIKQTKGKTMFVIDEAHFLLHSDEMVEWLQKAAREWARYDACLWFVTQSPGDFVDTDIESSEDKSINSSADKRQAILEQCSTVQFYRVQKWVDQSTLMKFGMNEQQAEFIRKKATPGRAEKGYTESLVNFSDHSGWMPLHVEASEYMDSILNYDASEHGTFDAYMQRLWGISPHDTYADTPSETTEESTTSRRGEEAFELLDLPYPEARADTSKVEVSIADSPPEPTDDQPETNPRTTRISGREFYVNPSDGVPIEEISGIGETYAGRLQGGGIESAGDLLRADLSIVIEITGAPEQTVVKWMEQAETHATSGDGEYAAVADGWGYSDDDDDNDVGETPTTQAEDGGE